jgi:hypothetical protein
MNKITLIVISFFLTVSMHASENLGYNCAKYFKSLQEKQTKGSLNSIANYVKNYDPENCFLPDSEKDDSMRKVLYARLDAVRQFYSLVKRQKVNPATTTLSALAHDLVKEDKNSARYLLEDSEGFAVAAVQLALAELPLQK